MPKSPYEVHLARFTADPGDQAAFEVLEEHRFMESDWRGLTGLYRARLEAPALAERPRQRAQLYLRLGQVFEERMSDDAAAIDAYTEAVRLDPSLRRALRCLRRIYVARRSWGAVLQIGEQEADLVETGEERARVYAEMGDVWLRELDDAEQAQQLYERARVESGGALPPRESAAPAGSPIDAPEGAAEPVAPGAAGAEGAEPDATPGSDADTADVSQAVEEDAAGAAGVRDAWLAAARGDTDGALAALERALEADPTNVEALDVQLSVLEEAERHEPMTGVLERRAALAADPDTRSAVLSRLGEIREQQGQLEEARDAYESALEAQPGHAGARDALCRIYRVMDAWSPLRRLLESAVEASEGAARADRIWQLASLLRHQLDDPDAARELLARGRELAPDDPRFQPPPVPEGEEQLALTMPDLETGGDLAEQRSTRVVGVLERKLAAREARGEHRSPEAVRLRLRIGELRAGALGEPEAAVEVLEPLREDPETLLEVAPALAGLYEQLDLHARLMELAEEAAERSDAEESRLSWLRRAADAAGRAGEPDQAITRYRALLTRLPGDRGICAALCDLYRVRGQAEALVALLRDELPRADGSRELEIQLELASLLTESLEDVAGAIAHLRRCIEIEPGREDLLEWGLRACELRGGPSAQLDLIEHAAEHADDDALRAALLARRGTLLADSLDWAEEAADSWRAALALDPDQALARERLAADG